MLVCIGGMFKQTLRSMRTAKYAVVSLYLQTKWNKWKSESERDGTKGISENGVVTAWLIMNWNVTLHEQMIPVISILLSILELSCLTVFC